MGFRDTFSSGETPGKKKKKKIKNRDRDMPARANVAIFKEALLKDQRTKLERDGKRFADLLDEIAILNAEVGALKESLMPLVKTLGEKEKDYSLEDGRRLVIEKVGGGRSATMGAIIDRKSVV